MTAIPKNERRKNNRRHVDEIEATIKKNVARLGLENITINVGNSSTFSPDGLPDSERLKEEYEAFLTDPRRS